MKRDMNLIRAVLIKAQQDDPNGIVEGHSKDAVKYHRALAIQKGLLSGKVQKDYSHLSQVPAAVVITGLTWEGHDFIDAIENEKDWVKVKAFLADAGKQLTIETIKFGISQLFGVAN